jgi:hypothetical protein
LKTFLLIFTALVSGFMSVAQDSDSIPVRTFVNGYIFDYYNNKRISYAHVINQQQAYGIISDSAGMFRIIAEPGDTLFVSAIGYNFDIYVLEEEDMHSLFRINLAPRAYELPEVVIFELDTYEKFSQRFMEIRAPEKELNIIGIPKVTPREVPLLRDEEHLKSAGFALNSPVSFLYYNFNQREKNKRLYYQLLAEDKLKELADERLSDTIVFKITGLPLDEMEDFREFCNYEPSVLLSITDYELYLYILRKHKEYAIFKRDRMFKRVDDDGW